MSRKCEEWCCVDYHNLLHNENFNITFPSFTIQFPYSVLSRNERAIAEVLCMS